MLSEGHRRGYTDQSPPAPSTLHTLSSTRALPPPRLCLSTRRHRPLPLPAARPTSLPQTPDCLDKFLELKTGKKLTYVIYGLSEDKRSIVVLKTSEEKDFDTFVGELPEKECRWAVYDFEYTLPGGEGIRNKLCFIMW